MKTQKTNSSANSFAHQPLSESNSFIAVPAKEQKVTLTSNHSHPNDETLKNIQQSAPATCGEDWEIVEKPNNIEAAVKQDDVTLDIESSPLPSSMVDVPSQMYTSRHQLS